MKRLLTLLACLTLLGACTSTPQRTAENRASAIVAEIHNPASKKVLVAAHRGDWRNYPENSIPAIESVIRMGADIVELDLQLTRDSVLVACHDRTIDRTTSGRGKVSEITCDSIKRCKLRRAHNVVTDSLRMPTLREALEVCKDRIVVNVDKGYEYYDLVLAAAEELGVTEQILIKGKRAPDVVAAKFAEHPRNMMYMPIVNILRPQGRKLFDEYVEKGVVPLAFEVCWDTYTPQVRQCMEQVVAGGSKLWVNSIWSSLCGGLCDDTAFDGDPSEVYGKLVEMGATMIQTDRPELLISYLRSRGLHD